MTVVASNPPNTDRDVPEKSHYAARTLFVLTVAESLELRDVADSRASASAIADGSVHWKEAGAFHRCEGPPAFTYFMAMLVPRYRPPIKIGSSLNPVRRAWELGCGSPYPIVLLAAFPDGLLPEFEMHHRFRRFRLRGEWFRPHIRLHALIKFLAGLPGAVP